MAHVFKSSTILIDFDDQRRVYSSVDEIPPEVRRRILSVFSGMQTGTIVIADRNGRKELARRIAERGEPASERPPQARLRVLRWLPAGVLLLGGGAALWLLLIR